MVLTPTIKQNTTNPKDIPKDELKYEIKATTIEGRNPKVVTIFNEGKNLEILSKFVPFIALILDILNKKDATII